MQIGIRRTGSNVLNREARRQLRKQKKLYRKRRRLWGNEQHFGGSPVLAKSAGRATVSGARFAIFFTGIAWFSIWLSRLCGWQKWGCQHGL